MTEEIALVKKKIYDDIVVNKAETVYDPDSFREFCISAGATKLFYTILDSVTGSKHSTDRIHLNKKKSCFIHLQFVLLPQPNMQSSSNGSCSLSQE